MEREMQSPTAQVVTIQTATMESVLSHALVEEETTITTIMDKIFQYERRCKIKCTVLKLT